MTQIRSTTVLSEAFPPLMKWTQFRRWVRIAEIGNDCSKRIGIN